MESTWPTSQQPIIVLIYTKLEPKTESLFISFRKEVVKTILLTQQRRKSSDNHGTPNILLTSFFYLRLQRGELLRVSALFFLCSSYSSFLLDKSFQYCFFLNEFRLSSVCYRGSLPFVSRRAVSSESQPHHILRLSSSLLRLVQRQLKCIRAMLQGYTSRYTIEYIDNITLRNYILFYN